MTPEVRKGIEELLVDCKDALDDATIAWLKLQLDHNNWDNSIERLGGGRSARDAYMNPIFDTRCSVTAFDMHAQLTGDGRERGLWIWLDDQSKARAASYDKWAANALEEFCQMTGIAEESREKFRMSMSMDRFKSVANDKVHEAALLEWPAVQKMYDVIGKVLASRAKPKAKKPKKKATPKKRRA